MPQTFIHSAQHPTSLMLSMGCIPRFDKVCLLVNTSNNTPHISYFDSPDFSFEAYPLIKEVDDWTVCTVIYNACKWFKPYIGRSELTPVFMHAITFMDGIIANLHVDPLPRIQMIMQLKEVSSLCAEHMPFTVAKLEKLMEEEATARLLQHKAIVIQSKWREVVVDPYHIVCQRRLKHEFQNMVEAF